MAEDVQYQIDANVPVLVFFPREERADSEGAILTAEKDGLKIIGLGSSAVPHSGRMILLFNSHLSPLTIPHARFLPGNPY